MEEIDEILLKLHHKISEEDIKELLKEFKNDEKITEALKELQWKES